MFPVQTVESIDVAEKSSNSEIWNATIQQINKDFQIELEVATPEEVHDLLNSFLTQSKSILEYLYRVDLPQQIYYACFKENTLDTAELTTWIIKREMYKVLLRNQYNG